MALSMIDVVKHVTHNGKKVQVRKHALTSGSLGTLNLHLLLSEAPLKHAGIYSHCCIPQYKGLHGDHVGWQEQKNSIPLGKKCMEKYFIVPAI